MISYPEALSLLLRHTAPLEINSTRLECALGFFLAQDVIAQEPAPPFDQSNMDGFGVRRADVKFARRASPARLPIIRTIRAGEPAGPRLDTLAAVKVFTGAAVPRGVDAVVIKEVCREAEGYVIIGQPAVAGDHVRRCGIEFRRGTKVLRAGTLITPPVIGLLASLGCTSFRVFRKPAVTLLATGNELVSPDTRPGAGQIRDANSSALAAALEGLGIGQIARRRVPDKKGSLRLQLAKALARSDVVITVGGVSVGDYDYVKEVLAELGVRTVFWQVAIKPGMPNYFGILSPDNRRLRRGSGAGFRHRKWVFGLPGNPVSALVSFHQLVRPALLRLAGQPLFTPWLCPAVLTQARHKKAGRLEWVRGRLKIQASQIIVQPTDGQMSHMLSGLAAANSLIHFPADATELAAQDQVAVEPFSWTPV